MPTAMQQAADLMPAFAQVLNLSFASAGGSSRVLTPGTTIQPDRNGNEVVSTPLIGGNRKPARSHQAADSVTPAAGSVPKESTSITAEPTFNFVFAPSDPTATRTVSFDAGTSWAPIPQPPGSVEEVTQPTPNVESSIGEALSPDFSAAIAIPRATHETAAKSGSPASNGVASSVAQTLLPSAESSSPAGDVQIAAGTPSAPPSPAPPPSLPGYGGKIEIQDPNPVPTPVWAPTHGFTDTSTHGADRFIFGRASSAPGNAGDTAMAQPPAQFPERSPSANAASQYGNPEQADQKQAPSSTNFKSTFTQVASPTAASALQGSVPTFSISQPSASDFQESAKPDVQQPNAPAAIAAPVAAGTNRFTIAAAGSSTANNSTVPSETFPSASTSSSTVSAPTVRQPIGPVPAKMQMWMADGVRDAAVQPRPLVASHGQGDSTKTAAQTVPFVADPRVSSATGENNSVATPQLATPILAHESQIADSQSRPKITPSSSLRPAPQTRIPAQQVPNTEASKVRNSTPWTVPLAAPPVNVVASELTPDDDAVLGAPASAEHATAPASLPAPVRATAAPDVAASTALETSDATQESQAPVNSRASRVEAVSSKSNSVPSSAAIIASDAPEASQQTSLAASSAKVELTSQPPASSADGHPSASGDAPLPSAVRVRDAAETIELSKSLQAWNGGDNSQTRLVQSASLGGNLRESEMNIALHAETLGSVELRTRVVGDVVGASIGVERHEAHTLIASDLPALHQALHERQLRVGEVSVFQGPLTSGGAAGDGRQSRHQEGNSPRPSSSTWTAERDSSPASAASFNEGYDAGAVFDSNGRLSVRA